MDAGTSESTPMKNPTTAERKSDRELVVTRTFDAPVRLVYEAWTKPELFKRWWVPKASGMTLLSCDLDVRVGGKYRLEFAHPASPKPFEVFGKYLEVTPESRIVWTNDEGDADGPVTTLTFEEKGSRTLVTVRDLYPTKEALEAAVASGSTSGLPAQLEQLDEFLGTLAASEGPA